MVLSSIMTAWDFVAEDPRSPAQTLGFYSEAFLDTFESGECSAVRLKGYSKHPKAPSLLPRKVMGYLLLLLAVNHVTALLTCRDALGCFGKGGLRCSRL